MHIITLVLIITYLSSWDGSVKKIDVQRIEYVDSKSCEQAAKRFNTNPLYSRNILAVCADIVRKD